MRGLFTFIGITLGSLGGLCVAGFAGWLLLHLIDGANALSNPDLPGGIAWLCLMIFAAAGVLLGGISGVWLGKRLFLQWQSESQQPRDSEI
ncbi:MAG: hypothetical protein DWQ45_24470 [Planctomycetota bacterium]|nr:MAG: hypothetical protein DWQ29_17710 [Planctomycetota bacterium]REK21078.1 MAG: hypothetical protein DWQ41_22680 [Planctomycetota bacterium]REK28527.1 MAG: hypothetical protein DWQ45_24470 [Planctomycetota bacterium]